MKTETKHTKGQWEVNSQMNLVLSGKKWIADLKSVGFEIVPNEEIIANAKLIAIAPELLEIVIEYDKHLNGLLAQDKLNENGKEFHEYIKRVIKKVTV